MKIISKVLALAASAAFGCATLAAQAAEPLKIGFIAPMSGPSAEWGQRMYNGVKAYIQQHGDTVAGRKVEVIVRDTTGPLPDMSRRFAQELLANDKVDFLAGFAYTPEALGAAPLATKGQTPMIVMNASSSSVTTKSPFIARVSFTEGEVTAPLATWAAKNNLKNIYTVVADYGPGIDAEEIFAKAFMAAGGTIAGDIRVPLQNPDYSPFVQRVKDAKPAAVFFFSPGGDAVLAFMKAFNERGLGQAGIKVLLASQLPDETLQAMGPAAQYVVLSSQYLQSRDTPENRAFLKAYSMVAPAGQAPTPYSVAAYDGMDAIYQVVTKLNGQTDGAKAMALLKGMKLNSPRGPVTIDATNRDVVQTIYVADVKRQGNRNVLNEIAHFDNVKDPGKL
jgi:branched-chain amino acid transport system substrate-binding protein